MSRTKALIEAYSNLDSKGIFQIHKIKSMENKNNLNIMG